MLSESLMGRGVARSLPGSCTYKVCEGCVPRQLSVSPATPLISGWRAEVWQSQAGAVLLIKHRGLLC